MIAFPAWQILTLCLYLCVQMSSGALDASAVLLDCKNDSLIDDLKRTTTPYHTIGNCTRKIRITLNITNSGKTPPDLDYSFLSQITDLDTGIPMYLMNPIVLRLRQDQVLLAYPFNYLSAVNGKASEIIVNYENSKNFTGCDDTSQVNPTCGLKHDRGKAVPFSEGFCCFCPEIPVKENQVRGGQDCSLDVGDPSDMEKQKFKASAHCLQFSDIWYSVSALSEPTIIHETSMQVYIQKHLKNGSSVWVALTHDEDFELGFQNPYQYDDNKTILISYMTSSPKAKSATIPVGERRLLSPQPMPAVELAKLPPPVKNGATDYLLVPKDLIKPDGDDCDVAGISYEAFSKQSDRCNIVKDTCLKNQPLDFWKMDDEKRKSGEKGTYLLENYGTPYKEPIIVHPETKEHWLATEYYEEHVTVLTVEVNADEITIMYIGQRAQISKIISSSTKTNIDIHVSILNGGLMPAKFSVQAVKCGFEVPNSNMESIVIPPQMMQDVLISTKPGSVTLDEKLTCSVQVSSESYGVVAKRDVTINPLDRCVCNYHCECACLKGSLKCEVMSEEDYHAAGFLGSLPVLTAKPLHKSWFIKHSNLALLAFVLLFLLIGFIKGLFGLAGLPNFGNFGLKRYIFQPKKINKYQEPELRNVTVLYDSEGYPINPDTRQRVKVIRDDIIFLMNLFFCFFLPCIICKDCLIRAVKKNGSPHSDKSKFSRKDYNTYKDSSYYSDDPRSKDGSARKDQDKKRGNPASAEYRSPPKDKSSDRDKSSAKDKSAAGDKSSAKDKSAAGDKSPEDKSFAEDKSPAKDKSSAGNTYPSKDKTPALDKTSVIDKTPDIDKTSGKEGLKGSHSLGSSSDSFVGKEHTGPIADPINKEMEMWTKGTNIIKAVV